MSGTGEELTARQATPARGRRWFRRPSHWVVAAGLLVCVAALAGGVLLRLGLLSRSASSAMTNSSTETVPDRRLDYRGPFLNVRPDVGYVGDSTCVDCHKERARTYGNHPMGRSLAPIGTVIDRETAVGPVGGFKASGLSLAVKREGRRMIHRESRLDESGKPVWSLDLPVDYVIGSGTRGASFLFQLDGYLFQTPISWFAPKHFWGLSPRFNADLLAGRAVPAECLFCHANRARPIEGTYNRFEEPLSDGCGIGCERCHGPGELHVRNPGIDAAARLDPTIVNPARLAPALREAVCEQCHLEGASRIIRRGRAASDFRPGLPLESALDVFVKTAAGGADQKAVNHVEQMYQSGCYRRGAGDDRIGCVSCHDPHDYVGADRRVTWYRAACQKCHGGKQPDCSVPEAERRRSSPDDSCIQCHMPPYGSSDIVHNASTDHRIPRRPAGDDGAGEGAPESASLAIRFHHDNLDEHDAEYRRDLALALAAASREKGDRAEAAGRQADALLAEAVRNFPDDVAALEAQGWRALAAGRTADALAAFEACLAHAPGRELALGGAAGAARTLGKDEAALSYLRRFQAVDPYFPATRQGLAEVLAGRGQWAEARDEAAEWVRLAPASAEARKLLIRCRLKTGDRAGAEADLKDLKALRPGSERDLDHWFDVQQR